MAKPGERAAKKVARKRTTTGAKKRAATRRPARKTASSPKTAKPKLRPGLISHTEIASADPPATRRWCERVLGWKFGRTVPTPTGPYDMWRFPNGTGGGIRANNPPEVPGSIPYCEVKSIRDTFSLALKSGAREMLRPEELPDGMGWIAIVAAPGGVPIGFWSKA